LNVLPEAAIWGVSRQRFAVTQLKVYLTADDMFRTHYGFLIDNSAMLIVITLDVEGDLAHPAMLTVVDGSVRSERYIGRD
jgi:hypothetical protein